MLISKSFMTKFSCHPMHIKAHSQCHTMHLWSREGAMRITMGGVYASALREVVHVARQRAWTWSESLYESYSAKSLVRVAMVISTISWPGDRGKEGAAIASTRCTYINARKVEAKSCGHRSAKEHRRGCSSAEEHRRGCGNTEERRACHHPQKSQRPAPMNTF